MNISKIAADQLANIQAKNSTSIEKDFSFKDLINTEMEKLNDKQVQADRMTQGFISGQVEDLHSVMIATEEARISLELAVKLRNKVVEAYKEINNMQL